MRRALLVKSKILLPPPLPAHSSLGPHDQSVFLFTELQTAWNQDEIGLQTEALSAPPTPISPALPTSRHLDDESKHVLFYLWEAANILFLAGFLRNMKPSQWALGFKVNRCFSL